MGRGSGARTPPAATTRSESETAELAVVEVMFQRPITEPERTNLENWLLKLPYYLSRDGWYTRLVVKEREPQDR